MIISYSLLARLIIDNPIAWMLGGYALGSIPIAWLVTKLITGEDLRNLGSGNLGVMNTALSATRWAGLLVFLAEIAKGVLAVAVPRLLGENELTVCLTVLAVVIGTRWSFWLKFTGGRGNTAGMAALALISWQTLVAIVTIWLLIRLLNHSSFAATRLTLCFLPVVITSATRSWLYGLFGLLLSLIYLSTQHQGTDDHLILKANWSSFWDFLTSPPRQ